MKKVILIIISILIIVSLSLLGYFLYKEKASFYLEDKYYNNPLSEELELNDIKKLMDNKESFIVFVHQPLCENSNNLEKIIRDYSLKNGVFYYTIAFSKIKDDKSFSYLKYYPSFIIFKKGEMVSFLDANSDEDTKKFKDAQEFSKWLESYIKVRKENYTYTENNPNQNEEKNETNNETIDLEDIDFDPANITREDNKVNVYLFWRIGCPFCQKEKEFLNSLPKEYRDKCNIYLFEISENENNRQMLYVFAEGMQTETSVVPFTVIGNKYFKGFDEETTGKEIKEAIDSQYINSYDVYFDTILDK